MSGGWQTIESDAGVFTYLVDALGVQDVQFEELLSLDTESLQALSPIYGVIFLFKFPTDQPYRAEKPLDGSFDTSAAENMFFAHQQIQNACGTQALLSVLLNKDSQEPAQEPTQIDPKIDIGGTLRDFKSFTIAFPPDLRGDALSNSAEIRDVHNSFARASPFVDEQVRQATGDEDVFHFIAYTSINGTLYELDGLQPHPISHGLCEPSQFADKVVPVLQRRVQRYSSGEIRFNLLAMVRDRRIVAKDMGDLAGAQAEERRRRDWAWELELRRANLIGFVGDVMKEVTRSKVKAGKFDEWVDGAKKETKRKLQERAKRGGGETMDVD